MIGGKWKPVILYQLHRGNNRFGLLFSEIQGINKQMLAKQLREMEQDGILERKVYPEIPPRVEYYFTDKGHELFPIIDRMRMWGEENMPG